MAIPRSVSNRLEEGATAYAPDDVLLAEIEGEVVLLHLPSEIYYGLDDVGTRMWYVLTSGVTLSEAYDTLLSEYDVRPDILRQDLERFIAELEERQLIRIDSPQ